MSDTIQTLTQHYAAVRKRLTTPKPRIVEVVDHEPVEPQPIPVVVTPEEPADAPIVASPPKLSVKKIASAVAGKYGVTVAQIASPLRTAKVVHPRHITMYLARLLTTLSLPRIGRAIGGKDHTSVLHASRKIEGLRRADAQLDQELNDLEAQLTGPEPCGQPSA